MAYSADYKKLAVEYKREGHTFKELKAIFKIPSTTYYRWEEEYENGFEKPKGPRRRTRKIDLEKLKRAVEEHPDFYLREFAELFGCTPTAIFYALKKINITLKKRHSPTPKKLMKKDKNF